VPVAQRRARARRYAQQLAKQGQDVTPVEIEGRTIARTFWGKAWCENLESYSDFENRLPRGRTYVRNGSVIDLQIRKGTVAALVSGSEIYEVRISIKSLPARLWKAITRDCSQGIDSLLDLLQGRLSNGVMQRLTRQRDGLFPKPAEIEIRCSCPDWAVLCKHAAAALYGVGARLDEQPELLFTLRDVDHTELISQAVAADNLDAAMGSGDESTLAEEDLSELFGIDLDTGDGQDGSSPPKTGSRSKRTGSPRGKKTKRPKSSKKRATKAKTANGKPAKKAAKREKAEPTAAEASAATAKVGKITRKASRRRKRPAKSK